MIELRILMDEVDYAALSDWLIPMLAESMKDGKGGILGDVFHKNPDLAASMARTVLSKLSERKKEELLLQLMNKYHDSILRAGRSTLSEHRTGIHIASFSAAAISPQE